MGAQDATLSKQEIWDRLPGLLETVAAHAEEVERLGRMPEELRAAMRAAGAFRINFPAHLGGPEFTLVEHLRYVQAIAAVSPSVGWLEMILSNSGFMAGRLDPESALLMFPSMDLSEAGGRGSSRADRVEGGLIVNGEYPFVSAVRDADRIAVGGPLFQDGRQVRRPDGLPVIVTGFPANPESITLHDTWDVDGLRGSDSRAISAKDAFIPDGLWVEQRNDGAMAAHSPLAGYPLLQFLHGNAVLHGAAGALLDEVEARLAARRGPSGHPALDATQVRRELMHARGLLQAADAMLYDFARESDARLAAGERLDDGFLSAAPLTTVVAAELCRQAIDEALPLTGSEHVFRSSRLSRLHADFRVGSTHIVHRRDFLDRAALLWGRSHDWGATVTELYS